MFFNRKMKESVEKNREIFSQIAEKSNGFDAQFTKIAEESKQVRSDILQVIGTIKKITEHAKTNIQTENIVANTAEEFADFFQKNQKNYEDLQELIHKQLETSMLLVEENKHYTTPARYLNAIPEALRKQSCSYEHHLDEISEFGKQINVLALNAAIEAGRMGECGKPFVNTAEEIRQTVVSHEKETLLFKKELLESQKQIAELEKTVQQLVKRMKNNNKGTAKLFKKCQDTVEKAETISFYGFSEKLDAFREKFMELQNREEEIRLYQEKCGMQLEDAEDMLKSQKYAIAALANEVSYVFELTKEQTKEE